MVGFKLDCNSETKHQIVSSSNNNLNDKDSEFESNESLDLCDILLQLKEWNQVSQKIRVLCDEI